MSAWGKLPRRSPVDFLGEQVDIVGEGGGVVEALAGGIDVPVPGRGRGRASRRRCSASRGLPRRARRAARAGLTTTPTSSWSHGGSEVASIPGTTLLSLAPAGDGPGPRRQAGPRAGADRRAPGSGRGAPGAAGRSAFAVGTAPGLRTSTVATRHRRCAGSWHGPPRPPPVPSSSCGSISCSCEWNRASPHGYRVPGPRLREPAGRTARSRARWAERRSGRNRPGWRSSEPCRGG